MELRAAQAVEGQGGAPTNSAFELGEEQLTLAAGSGSGSRTELDPREYGQRTAGAALGRTRGSPQKSRDTLASVRAMREQLAELHGMSNAVYGGRTAGRSYQRGGKSAEEETNVARGHASSTGMSSAEAFMLMCIAAVAVTALARGSGVAGTAVAPDIVPPQQAAGDTAPDRQAYNPVPGI